MSGNTLEAELPLLSEEDSPVCYSDSFQFLTPTLVLLVCLGNPRGQNVPCSREKDSPVSHRDTGRIPL